MTSVASSFEIRRRAIRLWLLAVATLIFVTVTVGGATRLTESGLSIVEWKPVTGVIPPFDAAAWQTEFDKYKAIPQYRERHPGMSLDEFKTIYWWEWTHRLLARLVGGVFLVPFLWFLWRGWIDPPLRTRLWTIFALGAALGVVGWLMVASGLSERIRVSQYWLAFHLTLACLIFAATVWTAEGLAPRACIVVPRRIRVGALVVLVLILVQIYLGALVSGTFILMLTSPRRGRRWDPEPSRPRRSLMRPGARRSLESAEPGRSLVSAEPGSQESAETRPGLLSAAGRRDPAAAHGSDTDDADDEPQIAGQAQLPDETGQATGTRQDVSGAGGYRSRHRLPDQNENSRRAGARRSTPRHAAPSASFGARMTGRMGVRALASGARS